MRYLKVYLSLISVAFATMVYGTHQSGQFYPWVHGFGAVFAIGGLGLVRSRNPKLSLALGIIVITAVAIRVFLYTWPASMIGMDPDNYAAGVNHILRSGSIDVLAGQTTYADLPVFYSFNAVTSLVTGVTGYAVLLGIPLTVGVLLPTFSATIARRIGVSREGAISSGLFGAIAAAGILYAYWPIANVIAILIWFSVLLALVIFSGSGDQRGITTVVACTPALVFAHKISLFVPFGVLAATVIAYRFRTAIFSQTDDWIRSSYVSSISIIGLIFGLALALQWTFVTEFARSAIIGKVLPLLAEGTMIVPPDAPVLSATRSNSGILGILARRAHYLFLLPVVGLCGAWIWFRRRDIPITIVVSAAAVPAIMIAISVFGISVVAPRRMVAFGLPAFIALIIISVEDISAYIPINGHTALVMVLVPILLIQVVVVPVAPDYPNEPRKYLTQGEVEGKSTMLDHSRSPVAMDFYYAYQQVDVGSTDATVSGGSSEIDSVIALNSELYNGTLLEHNHDTLLLREHADVIRFGIGGYRLQWDPIDQLSRSSRYARVYDNGHSVGFVVIP